MQRQSNTFDSWDEFISQIVSRRGQVCAVKVTEGLFITISLDWSRHRQCDSRSSETKKQRSEVHCERGVTSGREVYLLHTWLNRSVVSVSCSDVLPVHHPYRKDEDVIISFLVPCVQYLHFVCLLLSLLRPVFPFLLTNTEDTVVANV